MKYTTRTIPGESFNRFTLAGYYGSRAAKEIKLGNPNNAFMYARTAFHHSLELLHRQQSNVHRPRRKAENCWSKTELKRLKPGDCHCSVA